MHYQSTICTVRIVQTESQIFFGYHFDNQDQEMSVNSKMCLNQFFELVIAIAQ
jgi:hypothetical protein